MLTFRALKAVLDKMNDAALDQPAECYWPDQMHMVIMRIDDDVPILQPFKIAESTEQMEAVLPLIYESWVKGGKKVETIEDCVNNMGYDLVFVEFRERPWGVVWETTLGGMEDCEEFRFFTRYAGRNIKTEEV